MKDDQVTWASMPRKDQLLILCFVRIAEPILRISVYIYLFYQLQFISPELSSEEIIRQAAYLQAAFSLPQCFASPFWGKLADSPEGGRKLVMLISLVGCRRSSLGTPWYSSNWAASEIAPFGILVVTGVSFGFITKFWHALALRAIEGIFNGNVAIARTMISEVVKEKKYQARAFVLFPISFNIAAAVGPILGGQLADLGSRFPDTFGNSSFLKKWPYAPPAIANGILMLISLILVFFFLEETHKSLQGNYDLGLALSGSFRERLLGQASKSKHRVDSENAIAIEEEVGLMDEGPDSIELKSSDDEGKPDMEKPKPATILPLRRMFTLLFVLTLLSYSIQEIHITSYNTLWSIFLSDPIGDRSNRVLPFQFGGGAGMKPSELSLSVSLTGIVGLPFQLLAYPRVSQRLGVLKMWRIFLRGYPLLYFVVPFIALASVPSSDGHHGVAVWVLIIIVQVFQVMISSFAIPAQLVLTNMSSPHPTALARTHSIAFMTTGIVRTVSAVAAGIVYGYGSAHNTTELAWWILSVVAISGCLLSQVVREGNGHEIWLTGDEE